MREDIVRGIGITLAMVMAALLIASSVKGQSGHERWHQYYRGWKMPGTNISCCHARVDQGGVEVGDCEPTRAELRNGDWYAWERFSGQWIHIPDKHIVRERNPSGEEGHLCFNQYTKQIMCFVPPDTGG
jgi:hypothetical protein